MVFILMALIGMIAGLASGLLGIGGGVVLVPMFAFFFQSIQLPEANIMHLATGSSLAVIIFTSMSSVVFHQRHGAILFQALKVMVPTLMLSVVIGVACAHFIPTRWLEAAFGLFLLYIAIHMILLRPLKTEGRLSRPLQLTVVSFIVGFKSGVLGLGGGILTTPYFAHHGFKIKKAAGTSACVSLTVAVLGALTSFFSGLGHDIPYAWGYIYWPALLLTAPMAVVCAPIGVWLAHCHLPDRLLKRIFAVILLVIAAKMLLDFVG